MLDDPVKFVRMAAQHIGAKSGMFSPRLLLDK